VLGAVVAGKKERDTEPSATPAEEARLQAEFDAWVATGGLGAAAAKYRAADPATRRGNFFASMIKNNQGNYRGTVSVRSSSSYFSRSR
jgi:hypothetical protein